MALLCDTSRSRVKVVVSDSERCHYADVQVANAYSLGVFRDAFIDAMSTVLVNDAADEFRSRNSSPLKTRHHEAVT